MKSITIQIASAFAGGHKADGATIPYKAGWGAVLTFGEHTKVMSGLPADKPGQPTRPTYDRAALTALIEALECLKYPVRVEVISKASILRSSPEAIKNGFKYKNKEAANRDLLERLAPLLARHTVIFTDGYTAPLCKELAEKACSACLPWQHD